MPIEIRELVIRATVAPAGEPGDGGSSSAARDAAQPLFQSPAQDDEGLVQTCVREVLRVLADRQER